MYGLQRILPTVADRRRTQRQHGEGDHGHAGDRRQSKRTELLGPILLPQLTPIIAKRSARF
jgi:hypothetical protein